MKRIVAIIFVVVILSLVFGCSSFVKFNKKTAQGVMDFTRDSGEVVEEYLVSWPTYSGAIDGMPEWIKDWLPKAFWDAKNLTDDLSACCISLNEALDHPEKERCNFEDWVPDMAVPPELYYTAKKIGSTVMITAGLGKDLPFDKGDKKNEYVRGIAAGTAVRMANAVILEGLKGFEFIPEVANLLKIIPALAL